MKIIYILLTLCFFHQASAKVYTIKAGNHYPQGVHFTPFIGNEISRFIKFDDSAEYYLGNVNQYDINKLFGFADCLSHHQNNSVRFGWVWNDQTRRLEIHAYAYAKKKRSYLFISDVTLNRIYEYKIQVKESEYVLSVNGKSVTLPRGCKMKKAIGYRLYPYFGGDEVAPQEIRIEFDKK